MSPRTATPSDSESTISVDPGSISTDPITRKTLTAMYPEQLAPEVVEVLYLPFGMRVRPPVTK
jgi:hypothetical protein